MGLNDSGALLWKMGLIDNEFNQKLEGAAARVGNFATKMKLAFNVVAGAAILGYMDALVQRAGAIRDTADAFEMSTDSLQALDFTAKQAGVSSEKLHGAYSILAGKAAELASGNKEVKKAMEALNIDSAAFLKLPVDRQLEMIARGYAQADDKGKAFAAVADLIGTKNAPRLNAVLKQLGDEGLDGVIAKAKEAGQVLDEAAISRMDALGDRIDAVKGRMMNWGSAILDVAFKSVEGLGAIAGNVVNWSQGLETGYLATEASALKAIAKVEEVGVKLRGTKATVEELAKAEEARAKANEAAALDAMNALQKQEYYAGKIAKLEAERQNFSEGTKENLKVQAELADAIAKATDLRRKREEEIAKYVEDATRKAQLDREQAVEMVRLEMRGVANLNLAEKARYDQLVLIGEQKKFQVEIEEQLAVPAAQRTQEQRAWLENCIKQNDELGKQIAAKAAIIESAKEQQKAEKNVTAEIIEQVRQTGVLGKEIDDVVNRIQRVGRADNTRLTDRQLAEKERNLLGTIKANRDNDALLGYDSPFTLIAKQDLARVRDEQDLRRQFRFQSSAFGMDRALQFHSAFDEERLKSYVKDSDNLEKNTKLLESLDQRLSFVFPKNGAPR